MVQRGAGEKRDDFSHSPEPSKNVNFALTGNVPVCGLSTRIKAIKRCSIPDCTAAVSRMEESALFLTTRNSFGDQFYSGQPEVILMKC